jgi:hypothetical protein
LSSARTWPRVGAIAIGVVTACQFTHGTLPDDGGGDDACNGSSVECVDDSLRTCTKAGETPVDTPCAWGCLDTATPHCATLVPAGSGGVAGNGVMGSDLDPDGLADVVIGDGVTLDSDNGRIGTLAMPNLHHSAAQGIENGIDVVLRGPITMFRFKSLTINGTLTLVGSRPIAFVVDGEVTLGGVIDARGICSSFVAGPGGYGGGSAASANGGTPAGTFGGGTGAATEATGGGGGGYGSPGASGDAAKGGEVWGDAQISTLVGGAGGGAGDGGGNFGRGGGGGGALQIVSNASITVASGGINAGGCGGKAGTGNNDSGGGGGAGGTILLEAPRVIVNGTLAVNGGGGGGGGGNAATAGANGTLDRTPATGGSGDGTDEQGGNGAAGGTAATNGSNGAAPGGGGGGMGRIRINTRNDSGAMLMSATLSPSASDPGTSFSTGKAAVQ